MFSPKAVANALLVLPDGMIVAEQKASLLRGTGEIIDITTRVDFWGRFGSFICSLA